MNLGKLPGVPKGGQQRADEIGPVSWEMAYAQRLPGLPVKGDRLFEINCASVRPPVATYRVELLCGGQTPPGRHLSLNLFVAASACPVSPLAFTPLA